MFQSIRSLSPGRERRSFRPGRRLSSFYLA